MDGTALSQVQWKTRILEMLTTFIPFIIIIIIIAANIKSVH